ncbi:hypothetical protein ES703_126082 [subsurface metagenome]
MNLDHGEPFCTCPDYEKRHLPCKHIHAVEYVIQRETKPDGTTTYTESIKVTYNQEWHNYNEAQTHEQEHFVSLLRDLCNGIPQPEYKFGRPRLPLSDVVFGLTLKAYSDRNNLKAVQAVGGTAFIPFKSNSTAKGDHHHKFDGLWSRMWHFYNFNRDCFLQHYHKRSNVETAFSMIKAKFGASVRAKTPVAQVNEVLCKVLCHNICVLIQSIYELGLEPTFWTFDTKPFKRGRGHRGWVTK